MKSQPSLSDLEAFARKCIAAERYPGDYHTFTPFVCRNCGAVPLELTIEHHTGSRKGDFKGAIFAHCPACGWEGRVFSFTGDHRKPVRREKPVCHCGEAQFLVAECERLEGDRGIAGFFDEGVVVGECAACGRKQALAYTD